MIGVTMMDLMTTVRHCTDSCASQALYTALRGVHCEEAGVGELTDIVLLLLRKADTTGNEWAPHRGTVRGHARCAIG